MKTQTEDRAATKCECGCNRAQHANSRGMCNGYQCRCSRFVRKTRQFVHMRMMRDVLEVMIEELDGGRDIKRVTLSHEELQQLVAQMRKAIAGPAPGAIL